VRSRYGELAAQVHAARALTDRAADAWVAAAAQGWELTHEQRGAAAVELSAAKIVTTRTALDTASTVFELTAPGRPRRGDHLLTGAYPAPSRYS
jgi:alkylation response protein AidB-like acyl-CoA dehydrogenase